SPPTALELLRRHCPGNDLEAIGGFMQDWERWAAELLESHLSYPVLGYFRSQHDNESWLAALTMILDSCALVMAGGDGPAARTARLTFAMARHAAVDLAQVFDTPPRPPARDRLPPADLAHLREALVAADVSLKTGPAVDEKLDHLRRMYEPYVNALAEHLQVALPPWLPAADAHDNWRTAVWERYDGISVV
ncbi:MAG TPA: two pore domain potassium channel family protein, partial [Chloroflexia bacterium]